ncbi:hypothetical protein [Caldanaerobius fijiensis]|uniref:hypothetical protein n=1 Tax=Caldanaerobius fijiensis TaxID=456330 RepID=UPI0011604ECB|nr:hypothetical protein [Caldanaerobius fijiensis]
MIETIFSALLGTIVFLGMFQIFSISMVAFSRQNGLNSTTNDMARFLYVFSCDIHGADSVSVTGHSRVVIFKNGSFINYTYCGNTIARNGKPAIKNLSYAYFSQTPAYSGSGRVVYVLIVKNSEMMETGAYAE